MKANKLLKVIPFLIVSILLLAGCSSNTERIINGEVDTVKVEILSVEATTRSETDMMMAGSTPMLSSHDVSVMYIRYKYKGKIYMTSSENYNYQKVDGDQYAKIARDDIGKSDIVVVFYGNK